MGATLTPADIAAKQVRRAVGAVADYKAGVQAVKVSPNQLAAQASDRWLAGVQAAFASGKFVDNNNNTSLAAWQNAAVNKGAMNYGPGVQGALQTITDFQTQRAQYQQGLDAQLAQMPRGDIQQNIQRMVTQVTGMAGFAFKRRRV